MNELALEVRNLNVYFNGRDARGKKTRTQVLKDISLSVGQGESVGLVGESGSGKSTLAKAILGLVKNTEGDIQHHTASPQMVFQDPYASLNPARRIGWIMEEPLRIRKQLTAEKRRAKVREMLAEVGLEESIAKRFPDQLSGGQRQRVGIALTLIQEASFIIADEPVSALDVTMQKQVIELMNRLRKKRGLAYLFISHDLNVVYQMCDRIIVLKDGEIVETGARDQIFEQPSHEYTRVLLDSILDF